MRRRENVAFVNVVPANRRLGLGGVSPEWEDAGPIRDQMWHGVWQMNLVLIRFVPVQGHIHHTSPHTEPWGSNMGQYSSFFMFYPPSLLLKFVSDKLSSKGHLLYFGWAMLCWLDKYCKIYTLVFPSYHSDWQSISISKTRYQVVGISALTIHQFNSVLPGFISFRSSQQTRKLLKRLPIMASLKLLFKFNRA